MRHLVRAILALQSVLAFRVRRKRSSAARSAQCSWLTTTNETGTLLCGDGTECRGDWSCCSGRGGRAACPPNIPMMCNSKTCGGDDYCCKADCGDFGGVRQCPGATLPATLMVGNSYTYYNDGVDSVLRTFFAASNKAWYVKALTLGGSNWQYHSEQASSGGTAHHTALTSSQGGETSWGFVVFQEQSHVPGLCCYTDQNYTDSDFAASAEAVVELDRKAEARGATTILYQTWGRRDGHGSRPYLGTFVLMNDAVAEGYKHYASLITSSSRRPIIAPVGTAFRLIYDDILQAGEDPSDSSSLFYKLYNADASHPSDQGTYLAACVMYGVMTGENPESLPDALGLSGKNPRLLREAAARAIALAA